MRTDLPRGFAAGVRAGRLSWTSLFWIGERERARALDRRPALTPALRTLTDKTLLREDIDLFITVFLRKHWNKCDLGLSGRLQVVDTPALMSSALCWEEL